VCHGPPRRQPWPSRRRPAAPLLAVLLHYEGDLLAARGDLAGATAREGVPALDTALADLDERQRRVVYPSPPLRGPP
jgi:hypothetical protein